jgi:hypothetical protein
MSDAENGGVERDSSSDVDTLGVSEAPIQNSEISDLEPEIAEIAEIDGDIAEQLLERWGDQFDTNLSFARQAVQRFADQSVVEALEESGLGNDPRFVDMAAKVGRLIRNSPSDSETELANVHQAELEAELASLDESPDYWGEKSQKRVRQIHIALHGEDPVPLFENSSVQT